MGDIFHNISVEKELKNSMFLHHYIDALCDPSKPEALVKRFENFVTAAKQKGKHVALNVIIMFY